MRLCFPTVVANASPLTVLPGFVEILGRKLDKIGTELDRFSCSDMWNDFKEKNVCPSRMQHFEPNLITRSAWSLLAPTLRNRFLIDMWSMVHVSAKWMAQFSEIFLTMLNNFSVSKSNPYSLPGPLGWWFRWSSFWTRCRPSMNPWPPSCQKLQLIPTAWPSPFGCNWGCLI